MIKTTLFWNSLTKETVEGLKVSKGTKNLFKVETKDGIRKLDRQTWVELFDTPDTKKIIAILEALENTLNSTALAMSKQLFAVKKDLLAKLEVKEDEFTVEDQTLCGSSEISTPFYGGYVDNKKNKKK